VAQILQKNERIKFESNLFLALADCRTIALDTNFFVRANLYKGSDKKKIDAFDVYDLPSGEHEIENMTDDEYAEWSLKRLRNGKTVRTRR
jgi:hypothetical protein